MERNWDPGFIDREGYRTFYDHVLHNTCIDSKKTAAIIVAFHQLVDAGRKYTIYDRNRPTLWGQLHGYNGYQAPDHSSLGFFVPEHQAKDVLMCKILIPRHDVILHITDGGNRVVADRRISDSVEIDIGSYCTAFGFGTLEDDLASRVITTICSSLREK